MNNSLFNKYIWLRLIFGILLAIAGIIIIVLAIVNKDGISTALNITMAILLFLLGGTIAILSILSDTRVLMTGSLLFGAFLIALGVTILVVQNFVSTLLVILLAVFLITFGALCIVKCITFIIYHAKWLWYVALFLLGAVGITFGILALCYKDISFIATFIVVGVSLLAAGIVLIVLSIIKMRQRKRELAERHVKGDTESVEEKEKERKY